jgi:transcription-repair coupling factor (superfamily II helicase)
MRFAAELLSGHGHTDIGGIPHGATSHALAQAAQATDLDILYVATSDRDLEHVRTGLAFFAESREVLVLPAWDCLPYDRSSPNAAILAERIRTLAQLSVRCPTPRIILTTVNAAVQKLPPLESMRNARFAFKAGDSFLVDNLLLFLTENGYRRTATAMEAGEFAARGNIIDIIPSLDGQGIRLDMFGNTLESIRSFDPLTQRSSDRITEITLHPASEVTLSAASVERFREGYRATFGTPGQSDPLYEAISQSRSYPGMEHWLPLFYDRLSTLFDYVPDAVVILDAQVEMARKERIELTQEYYTARKSSEKVKHYSAPTYFPLPPDALYLADEQWQRLLEARTALTFTPFNASEASHTLPYRQGRNFAGEKLAAEPLFDTLKAYVARQREAKRATLFACYSPGSRERIATMLHEHGMHPLRIETFAQARAVSGKTVGLAILALEQGFEADDITLISEQDFFGERILRTKPKRKKLDQFFLEAANFTPGDLVVHREHGIGRFDGLVTLEVLGAQHDCLKLLYEGDDKLFLPVENIDLLSRYGSEEEGAKLDKLGSASWQSRQAKLKERITLAAEELIQTAAQRALGVATAYTPPQGLYEEFCARFPYVETEDQGKAIDDVLGDIASGRPTDRLVCGDVGFGKTEVALRAAFVAASSHNPQGRVQVAIVCPTTLLCRQHFNTFRARFDGLPFRIRQLSRLTSAKENKKTLEEIANGEVNIVIGTHALLGKSVAFKNLGMLIIDEEQHFGVAQKEKIKSLKSDIHVLTLSATPIPRTLQLALSGVRELSIIATPPVDRLAVRTFVLPFDPVVLREAILREHHRGGKIFYVTPRIKYMAELRNTLQELVPEIRVTTAHGQMAPGELDDVMNAFYDGKYDLLLSTSIVESGLDIPTANTIIIDRAEMFGLSQLYQLRGRVGRGKTRAYAYYTLPHKKTLSHAATRRLEVMQTLDNLGAGFTLASHDMDIRGFGNLLGEEQSGHVREVGIELYQQMLEEAVARAKVKSTHTDAAAEEAAPDAWSPQINLGMTVLIPEDYVQDLELRLNLYRRAAALASEDDIHNFTAELIDRFGPVPQEVTHLLAVVRLKQLCREAGVERVDAGPKGAVLTFRKNSFAKPEKLIAFIAKNAKRAKLRPDQKLVLLHDWNDAEAKLRGVRESISEIAQLAA